MKKILEYRSSPIKFGLLGEARLHKERVGNFVVSERFTFTTGGKGESELGDYDIVVKGEVDTESDLEQLNSEAVSLIEKVELLFPYAWATPLHGDTLVKTLSPIEPPERWISNKEDVRREFQKEKSGLIIGGIKISTIQYKYGDSFPLKTTMRMMRKYSDLEAVVKTMIDIHWQSLIARSTHSQLFLLAKCLELTRAYLPGKNDQQKERSLAEDARKNISMKYRDLFDLSNNRAETRHVVSSSKDQIKTHKSITEDEREAFVNDSNTIIRAIVCDALGEDLTILGDINDIKKKGAKISASGAGEPGA